MDGTSRGAADGYSAEMSGEASFSTEIQRADPRLRRVFAIVLTLSALAAVALVFTFHRWLSYRADALSIDQLVAQLRSWMAATAMTIDLCLLFLAAYAARTARRVGEQRRWPLADARVLRDTPIRRGAPALRLGWWLNATAIALALLALGIGLVGWRLFALAR